MTLLYRGRQYVAIKRKRRRTPSGDTQLTVPVVAGGLAEYLRKGKQRKDVDAKGFRSGRLSVLWEGFSEDNVMQKVQRFVKTTLWRDLSAYVRLVDSGPRNQFHRPWVQYSVYQTDENYPEVFVRVDMRGKAGGDFYSIDMEVTDVQANQD